MSNYSLLLTTISSIIFLTLGIYSYQYRKSPGGMPFLWAMVLLVFLGITTIGELLTDELQYKIYWRNFQQVPFFIFPVLIYILLLQFTSKSTRLIKRQVLFLSLPILIYLLLIFTDEWHHLMRENITLVSVGIFEQIAVDTTALSFLFILYSRLIVIGSLIILLVSLKKVSILNRKQYYLLIIATIIPFISNVIPETSYFKVNTAIASIPMGILYFYALFKYKFLHVHPVTNDKIIENIKEGIVVVDKHNLVVQLNPTSEMILQNIYKMENSVFIGENLQHIIEKHDALATFYNEKNDQITEVKIKEAYYSVSYIAVSFSEFNKGALLIFTDITAQKKHEQELIEKVSIDSLTQVYSRQYIQEAANEAISSTMKAKQPCSFILLDIDKFKVINDTYGHQVGDYVLQSFAKSLKDSVGEKGIVSRVGGEEFAVLLPNLSSEKAYDLAEEIRKEIENLNVQIDDLKRVVNFTVSIGVTETSNRNVTFKEIFNQADEALYKCKFNGRNQTIVM